MMMSWGYGSGWGNALMAISMVVFWGLVIGGVVLLVRRLSPGGPTGSNPQQILAERFARGEIDETEYRARLTVLGGSSTRHAH